MRGWNLFLGLTAALALVAVGCGDDDGTTFPEFDAGPIAMPDGGDFPERTVDPCDLPGQPVAGDSCTTDNDCDNGCFCDGLEVCVGGTCQAAEEGPCPDGIDCTEDVCFEELDRCFFQPRNEMCSDGDACNGFERCDVGGGCEPGPRLFCNDESACTVDSCNSEVGCVFTRRDLDGDGFLDGRCGGEDCNDDPREGIEIYPGAPEQCFNRLDDNCDGIRDFVDDACVPENDTCDTAQPLDGPGLYSASTKQLVGDYFLSCGRAGPDAVFSFTVPSGYFPDADVDAVDVTVAAEGPTNATIALRRADECAAEDADEADIRCNDGSSPSILQRSLPPGDYVIIIATAAPTTSFDLRLDFDPPTPVPAYDVCNAETETITESGTYEGVFSETGHDYEPSCGAGPSGGNRPDAAYRLRLTEAADVTLSASGIDPFGPDTTYVALYRDSCSDLSEEISCVSAFRTATLTKRELPAGDYFIVIETFDTNPIRWTLDVDISSPPEERLPGDACSTAADITTSAKVVSMSSDFVGDSVPSCGFSSTLARDAFFEFTLSELSDIDLDTSVACDPSASFCSTSHYQAILSECGLFTEEVGCTSGGPISTERRSVAAGTYFAQVFTTNTTHISATATLDISDPTPIPDNDRCDSPGIPEICDVTDPVFIDRSGTLVGFSDDISGTCAGSFSSPVDALYKCTLSEESLVNISATRSGTRLTGGLYASIRQGGCPGRQVSCSSAFSGSPVSVSTAATLDAGTYYIVIESRNTELGDFTLVAINSPVD